MGDADHSFDCLCGDASDGRSGDKMLIRSDGTDSGGDLSVAWKADETWRGAVCGVVKRLLAVGPYYIKASKYLRWPFLDTEVLFAYRFSKFFLGQTKKVPQTGSFAC